MTEWPMTQVLKSWLAWPDLEWVYLVKAPVELMVYSWALRMKLCASSSHIPGVCFEVQRYLSIFSIFGENRQYHNFDQNAIILASRYSFSSGFPVARDDDTRLKSFPVCLCLVTWHWVYSLFLGHSQLKKSHLWWQLCWRGYFK